MKVLVPLNCAEHVEEYIEAGADEFYLGFYDKEWEKKYGEYADINRMSGFKTDANENNLDHVCQVISYIKERGKSAYVTFNTSSYSEKQLEDIAHYLQKLKSVSVDGIIVSCIDLVIMARQEGIPSVVSTISGVYNTDIVQFFYERGAKRIILPRDLSMKEIQEIVATFPKVEYEVFMMRNGCVFSDSNCLGFHRSEMQSVCSFLSHSNSHICIGKKEFKNVHDVELNDMLYTQAFHKDACGLCAIYDFVACGITACKIVGRSDEWKYVCKDIYYVKKNIEIAKQCSSRKEYLEKMILPERRTVMCKLGMSCYYPEVRF